MANLKLKIIFFFVKLFKLNDCTYMWFDQKSNRIRLYVGDARSGSFHLPTEYVDRKYAIFLADTKLVTELKLKRTETVYVLMDVQSEEEFNKKRQRMPKTNKA